MLLRIAMMRSELQRQRRALSREMDLRHKERSQLQRKGKPCPAPPSAAPVPPCSPGPQPCLLASPLWPGPGA